MPNTGPLSMVEGSCIQVHDVVVVVLVEKKYQVGQNFSGSAPTSSGSRNYNASSKSLRLAEC